MSQIFENAEGIKRKHKKTKKKSKTKGKGKSDTRKSYTRKSDKLVNEFYMNAIDNPPMISSLHKTGIELIEDDSYAPGVKPRVEIEAYAPGVKPRVESNKTTRVIFKNPKTKSKGKKTQKNVNIR